MRSEDPTESEARFFEALSAKVPDVQDWYHRDADGALWMIVSYDVVDANNCVRETWRCDFDGNRLKAGSSPAFLIGMTGSEPTTRVSTSTRPRLSTPVSRHPRGPRR